MLSTGTLLAGVAAVISAGAAGGSAEPLRVGCGARAFPTIGSAVNAAMAGDTIVVCAGTYQEEVVVPAGKALSIEGTGSPVVDAAGHNQGVLIRASGTQVTGLTVENATGEGILVEGAPGNPISDVTVTGNTVVRNDRGNPTGAPISNSAYPECNASGHIPGDCGEGVHLMVAEHSRVAANRVTGNSGGILLTDEFGPTHDNVVASNTVSDNTLDCGVTVVGHNSKAFVNGALQPAVGGVYDNTVVSNTVTNNGVKGQGGGIIIATGPPGGAVYDNQIVDNHLSGNGLAGVTVHSHAPGQHLNGNVVRDNSIGTNNLDGDFDFAPNVDPFTTGVFVGSVSPLTITVTDNVISDNRYGIWTSSPVTVVGADHNIFTRVGTPVFVSPTVPPPTQPPTTERPTTVPPTTAPATTAPATTVPQAPSAPITNVALPVTG